MAQIKVAPLSGPFSPTAPGATATGGYRGIVASGAPLAGTWALGEWVSDQTGKRFTCTVAGTPGTWVQEPGTGVGGGGVTTFNTRTGAVTLAGGDLTALLTLLAPVSAHLVVAGTADAPTIDLSAADKATLAVAVTGTPTAGQVPTATSGTAATWQTPAGGGAVTSVAGRTGAIVLTEADIANLVADLAAKAPTSRRVISGTGLSGGGDLTVDRTLAVTYGTTAGSAAQGDDARFAGSAAGTASASLAATDATTTNARTPNGAASGDLTGTYPAPTLANTVNVAAIDAVNATGKQSARAVATTNIVVASNGLAAVDGVTPVDGDRILLTAQTTTTENGLWIAHVGAWTRAPDMAVGYSALGTVIRVQSGTVNARTTWIQTNATAAVVGTTALTFGSGVDTGAVHSALATAKGDLIAATASGVVTNLAVGANTQVLTADSTQAAGVKWAAAAGGGVAPGRPNGTGGKGYSIPGITVSTATIFTMSQNRAIYMPFKVDGAPITIDQLCMDVSTAVAGTLLRCAIYAATADQQPTGAPLADSGDLNSATSGQKAAAVSVTLPVGLYVFWANQSGAGNVVCASGASTTLAQYGPVSLVAGFVTQLYVAQTYGAPPASPLAWTTYSTGSALGYVCYLRIV